MTSHANPTGTKSNANGFVNRRSGVQSPHPAPVFSDTCATKLPRISRETREITRFDLAHKTAQSCTPTEHRCNAMGLAFFALMHTGDLDEITRAALAQCREGAK